MRNSPKGFTVVEGLLIFVIVVILAGTGYYVWHSTNRTNDILSKSSSTNIIKSPIVGTMRIKEWGIKLTFPYAYKLQGYSKSPSGGFPLTIPASVASYPRNNSVADKYIDVDELEFNFIIGQRCGLVAFFDRAKTNPSTLNPESKPQFKNGYYYFFQNPGEKCPSTLHYPAVIEHVPETDVNISEKMTESFKSNSFKVESL